MSITEEAELQDLVKETLEKSGSLAKIRAELRANIFLALEQNGCFKDDKYRNEKLASFMNTEEGMLAVNIFREFIEFFNLTFTATVFDAEIQASHNYEYIGREKTLEKLDNQRNISDSEDCALGYLLQMANTKNRQHELESFANDSNANWQSNILDLDSSENAFSPVNPFSPLQNGHGRDSIFRNRVEEQTVFISEDENLQNCSDFGQTLQPLNGAKENNRLSGVSEAGNGFGGTSLSSLDDLPPLTAANSPAVDKHKVISEKLKSALVFPEAGSGANVDTSQAFSLSDDEKKKYQEQKKSINRIFSMLDGSDTDVINSQDESESISEVIDEVLSVSENDVSSSGSLVR